MEHLTKQQIVLLTLLVSFVTSIATGIFTVTLMQQAPGTVTQTINKIVERTVERVVPGEAQKAQVIRQEVTTIIKQEDQIADAVSKNEESLVRIYGTVDSDPKELFLGFGVVVHSNGVMVTDRKVYAENATYAGIFSGGRKYPLELVRSVEGELVVFLKPTVPSVDRSVFVPAVLSNSDSLRLGQIVVSLSGEMRTQVLSGIVTGLETPAEIGTSTPHSSRRIIGVETNLPARIDIFGSPLVNVSSEMVGIYLGFESANGRAFLPVNLIKAGVASTTPVVPPVKK